MSHDFGTRRVEWAVFTEYDAICPGCMLRYTRGEKAGEYIDIERCAACESTKPVVRYSIDDERVQKDTQHRFYRSGHNSQCLRGLADERKAKRAAAVRKLGGDDAS